VDGGVEVEGESIEEGEACGGGGGSEVEPGG